MISYKSAREIEIMRRAGEIVVGCLELAERMAVPGVTTEEIDREVERFIASHEAIPAFKGYRGFPATICASINEQVVHGIPGRRRLAEGDIFSVDVGVRLEGYYADAARTLPVGSVSERARRLIETCRGALEEAVRSVRPGDRLEKIARTIQTYVERRKYSVVESYVGHGIGRQLHEEPQVPNFVNRSVASGLRQPLRPGMVIAIEPMVNEGTKEVETLGDGWTVVTRDRKLSAHFENTVAILEDRVEVLTVSPNGGSELRGGPEGR